MAKTESETYFEIYLEGRSGVFCLPLNERTDWGHKNPDYAVHLNTGVDMFCEVKEVNGLADIKKDFLTTLFRKLTSKVEKADEQIKVFNSVFDGNFLGVVIIYVRCLSDWDSFALASAESFPGVHDAFMRSSPTIAGIGFLMNDFRKHEPTPKMNPIVSFKRNPSNHDSRVDLVDYFFKK